MSLSFLWVTYYRTSDDSDIDHPTPSKNNLESSQAVPEKSSLLFSGSEGANFL